MAGEGRAGHAGLPTTRGESCGLLSTSAAPGAGSRCGHYRSVESGLCGQWEKLRESAPAHGAGPRGVQMGRWRVRRLMRESGLHPVWKRKFVSTTNSKHGYGVAENLLNRQFDVAQPNQAWVSDMTYIHTRQGWLYLAVVMDLCSRKIVGWATVATMHTELVAAALHMALQQRRPPRGLVLHSDRGSQYAWDADQALLVEHGIRCSMSCKGNCWDNAVIERFFLNLKMERVWHRDYASHAEAEMDITQYIVGFYNYTRLHSTLGYTTPAHYESNIAAKNLSWCLKSLDHHKELKKRLANHESFLTRAIEQPKIWIIGGSNDLGT